MYRKGMPFLNEWLASTTRKPLVIRGARQVGKNMARARVGKRAEADTY